MTNYWSENTVKIKIIGMTEGGTDTLQGKKIVNLYHDSAYGKETIPILETQAKMYGFTVPHIAVPHPGNEQQAQWLQIRQAKPDWVILHGWGVMDPNALKAAAKIGFPGDHIIGVWWSGAEEDVIPAGQAAKGYIAAGFNAPGANHVVISEIQKQVYAKGQGELEDKSRIGSIYYNRGVLWGILTTEAVRKAQERFGKGKPMTGEQVRWGLENLNIDDKRLKELGAVGFMQPLKLSCLDHEGGGAVKFQQWDGKQWKVISDWIPSDQSIVRPMIEASAAQYAKENGIARRDCSSEKEPYWKDLDDETHHPRSCRFGACRCGRPGGCPEPAGRSGQLLLGRPVYARRLGLRRRHDRLLRHAQRARPRHQRRQDHLGEVRDRIPQRPRRRVLQT